jgi:GGDEF domain-containing protein
MMKADQLSTGPTFTDKLTHLYNGQGFVRASEYLLASSNGPMPCAMLLAIEVGNLEVIEHALGREPVDLALIRTADILRSVFRGAVIGRLAVDRFAVLIMASPSKCTERIAALNEDIHAANLADPNIYVSLRGEYYLFDPGRSDSIESWTESRYQSKKIKPSTEGVVDCDESNSSSRF